MTARDELASIPLFESLGESDLRDLAPWFEVRTAGPGVTLAGEGAPGYSFFILTEGAAIVTSDDETLASLGPGDFFGEMAILGDGRRTATVTTTTPARLLVLFGADFRRLQDEHPAVAAAIEAAMRQRIAARS
jgi:CRP-like cAMP-binding protein